MVQEQTDWYCELCEAIQIFNAAFERAQNIKRKQTAQDNDQAYRDLQIATGGVVYAAKQLDQHGGIER